MTADDFNSWSSFDGGLRKISIHRLAKYDRTLQRISITGLCLFDGNFQYLKIFQFMVKVNLTKFR